MQSHSITIDKPNGRLSVEVLSSKQYKQHPLSAAFPTMSQEERQELSDSIENIGVQNPITIYEGMVLDGWHRYSIATKLGLNCPETDLEEDIDPRDFVLAQNKTRRHVTKSQLAIAFAKVCEWMPTGVTRGEPGSHLKTNQELAELAGTSTKTIKHAKQVLKYGNEEVVIAVESGKISAKRGAEIAKLPKDQQDTAIDAPAEPCPSILDGSAPDEEELAATELAIQADMDAMNKFLEADDKLAHLEAENKRLRHLNAKLEVRMNALMVEKNEVIKICKSTQRRLDKYEKYKY